MNVPHNLVKIDINEIKPSLVEYIQNEADNGVRVLDVMFLAQGRIIAMENGYTATATVSVNDVLITDNLSCTVDFANNLVKAEIDCKRLQLTGSGVMKVQITVSDGTNILISPQPVLICLTSDLAQTAQILPDSHSSYSEIVAEIVAARGDFDNLSEAIESKVSFVETTDPDTATDNGVWYKVRTNTENFALFAISTTAQQAQFRITSTGTIGIRRRYLSNGDTFPAWGAFERISWTSAEIGAKEVKSNKKTTLTGNENSNDYYPTTKAVADALNKVIAEEVGDLKSASNYTIDSSMSMTNKVINDTMDATVESVVQSTSIESEKFIGYKDTGYFIGSNQYWSYIEYAVSGMSLYKVCGTRSKDIPMVIFADSSGNYIGHSLLMKLSSPAYVREELYIETPLECTKIYVNSLSGTNPYLHKVSLDCKPDPYDGAINIRDIMNWELGSITHGIPVDSTTRIRTNRIYKFNYPLLLPVNADVTVGVWTYTTKAGDGAEWQGWKSDEDYVIPAGTYFRLLTLSGAMESLPDIRIYNNDYLFIYQKEYKVAIPLKWKHGVTNSTGDVYFNAKPCITDFMIPTAIFEYINRKVTDTSYTVAISYYKEENGVPVFKTKINITAQSPIHSVDHNYTFFVLSVFKDWSTEIDPSTCNTMVEAYSNKTAQEIYQIVLSYAKNVSGAYTKNYNFVSACHQGYSETGLGHNLPGGYSVAATRGFTHGECDIKLSSDDVPVCCHDASFVDATSGQTIVIAEKTLSELKACNYYGGTIGTFEEILLECKNAGLGLFIDHLNEERTIAISSIITKLRAWEMCYFLVSIYDTDSIQSILSQYSSANIVILETKSNYDNDKSSIISFAESFGKSIWLDIGQYVTADKDTIIDIAEELPTNVKLMVWTVDGIGALQEILPYINGWTSNVYSNMDLFDPVYGCGVIV